MGHFLKNYLCSFSVVFGCFIAYAAVQNVPSSAFLYTTRVCFLLIAKDGLKNKSFDFKTFWIQLFHLSRGWIYYLFINDSNLVGHFLIDHRLIILKINKKASL